MEKVLTGADRLREGNAPVGKILGVRREAITKKTLQGSYRNVYEEEISYLFLPV